MQNLLGWTLGATLVVVVVHGCSVDASNDTPGGCVPGTSQSCAGEGDCSGFQVCNAEGTAFEACDCDSGASGSLGSTGTSTNGGNEGGGAGEGPDTSATSATSSGGGAGLVSSSTGGSSAATANSAGGSSAATASSAGGAATITNNNTTGNGGNTTSSTSQATATTGGSVCTEDPGVLVLVDASSSMWDNLFWDPLREAVLGAVNELQGDVRFGLATFTGIQLETCPLDLQSVSSIGLDNYGAISDFYNAIAAPGVYTETPTAAALYAAAQLIQADSGSTHKAILLVTDGNPDYCDNGDIACRSDTTLRVIQDVYAGGIDVLVAALPDPLIDQAWLTAFANAGAGEPVSAPVPTAYCPPMPTETALILSHLSAASFPMASFSAQMGSVVPAALDASDVSAMQASITQMVSDWATCD